MVKKTKGGKVMNPTDAYRKELRKKELKRNKKERKKVREVGILKKDPEQIREQIQKLEMMKAEGALDKARKHKKRQLEDTLNVVLKKRKEYEEKMKEKGETPVMFSHLGPPRRRSEEDEGANQPKPEDSVYYHPTLNPSGAPPPGKPPMYKSSIGPRIPLSEASSSSGPESTPDLDNATLPVPPPPPPPPLPKTDGVESDDALITPESLPLPPPPPMPPSLGMTPSLPPPPPPPPGPTPKDQFAMCLPPPLPRQQPPPPGTIGVERESNKSLAADCLSLKDSYQAPSVLPPPPPRPPGLPHPLTGHQPDSKVSNSDTKTITENNDISKMVPLPPPPPRQPALLTGPGVISSVQPDVFPPGISRVLPPPPAPEMQPQPAHAAGFSGGAVAPPGMVSRMPRPSFGPPPGPPPVMRPPLPPGPPPAFLPEEHFGTRSSCPQKPSYVKSAAPTVVKRPLAQHIPELTAMVPASVRVRRESVYPKPKLKSSSNTTMTSQPSVLATTMKQPPHSTSSSVPSKGQSIDDSYSAFLEDMKALGALDS